MGSRIYFIDLFPVMSKIKKPSWISSEIWLYAWTDWLEAGGLFEHGGLCVKPRDNLNRVERFIYSDWSIGEYRDYLTSQYLISCETTVLFSLGVLNRTFYQRFILEREFGECTVEVDGCTAILTYD